MTSFSEALREISNAKDEILRKGYPGYLYSELATIMKEQELLKETRIGYTDSDSNDA